MNFGCEVEFSLNTAKLGNKILFQNFKMCSKNFCAKMDQLTQRKRFVYREKVETSESEEECSFGSGRFNNLRFSNAYAMDVVCVDKKFIEIKKRLYYIIR